MIFKIFCYNSTRKLLVYKYRSPLDYFWGENNSHAFFKRFEENPTLNRLQGALRSLSRSKEMEIGKATPQSEVESSTESKKVF